MASRIAASLMTALELTDIRAIDKACVVRLGTQFEFGPVGFQTFAHTLDPGLLQSRSRIERRCYQIQGWFAVEAGVHADDVELGIDGDSVVVQARGLGVEGSSQNSYQQPDEDCDRYSHA
jgi:hypothetical protein